MAFDIEALLQGLFNPEQAAAQFASVSPPPVPIPQPGDFGALMQPVPPPAPVTSAPLTPPGLDQRASALLAQEQAQGIAGGPQQVPPVGPDIAAANAAQPTIQDRLKAVLGNLKNVKAPEEKKPPAPPSVTPPQGRGLGVASRGGQTNSLLAGSAFPVGAGAATPTLGQLIAGIVRR